MHTAHPLEDVVVSSRKSREDERNYSRHALTGLEPINNSGLASLVQGCKELRSLNLGYSGEITDAGLASLAQE